jgi:hypothetical protein
MFTHALDVLASDMGCRDFADFKSRSRQLGARQLWWKLNGGCIVLSIVGAVIAIVLIWLFAR